MTSGALVFIDRHVIFRKRMRDSNYTQETSVLCQVFPNNAPAAMGNKNAGFHENCLKKAVFA